MIGTIESPSKIKNGTLLKLGSNKYVLTIKVDKHLNWFQKRMYKICFRNNCNRLYRRIGG